jgi:urease accessory protein
LLLATPAAAHTGHLESGFASGLLHPLTGTDHVLAMVAVGLWAAVQGRSAMVAWPISFVAAMLGGFAVARLGFNLPAHETMIAASLIALGGVLTLRLSASIVMGSFFVALAGFAHGFAHGLEAQGAIAAFAIGFAIATALLHVAGLGLGFAAARLSQWPIRVAGLGIALVGGGLASGLI